MIALNCVDDVVKAIASFERTHHFRQHALRPLSAPASTTRSQSRLSAAWRCSIPNGYPKGMPACTTSAAMCGDMDMRKFRALTLRTIAITEPYMHMHDGSIVPLSKVLDHANPQ